MSIYGVVALAGTTRLAEAELPPVLRWNVSRMSTGHKECDLSMYLAVFLFYRSSLT
jgi:hypothetical protein